jgi:hypothetical protein
MTRQDYVLIASALAEVRDTYAGRSTFHEDVRLALDLAAETLADKLTEDNPRFDRARFLVAAGVEFPRFGR